jgi:hypothetical protein
MELRTYMQNDVYCFNEMLKIMFGEVSFDKPNKNNTKRKVYRLTNLICKTSNMFYRFYRRLLKLIIFYDKSILLQKKSVKDHFPK